MVMGTLELISAITPIEVDFRKFDDAPKLDSEGVLETDTESANVNATAVVDDKEEDEKYRVQLTSQSCCMTM